jgi:hypothetical protein
MVVLTEPGRSEKSGESNKPVFRRRRVYERAIGDGIRTGDRRMNELLELAVSAHGGLERWKRIRSIDVSLIISGQLLEVKGFPEHQQTKVTIDADRPRTVLEPYGEEGARGIYTPGRVWIESRDDGREIVELKEPRASFAGHVRDTRWDQLQRLYFLGYAMWNYLATPFILVRDGFDIQELAPHDEDGERWRVLQVRYPKDIPTHCDTQQFYFNSGGILKRIDYTTDVLGGVASHYLYDPKNFAGLIVPTRRRVVQRTPAGPKITGITAVFLDYLDVQIHDR